MENQNQQIPEVFQIAPETKSKKIKLIVISSILGVSFLVGAGLYIINQTKQPSIRQMNPKEIYLKYLEAVNKEDWQEIKKYITQDSIKEAEEKGNIQEVIKFIKSLTPENVEVINEKIETDKAVLVISGNISMGGQSTATVEFIKENDEWKITKEDWKGAGLSDGQVKLEGNGSISGTVTLPNVNKKGDLFIIFVPTGQIVQSPESPRYFAVIKKENITSNKVAYKVENVPDGEYFGYATWDIAEPFWEPSWGEGNCPGYAGDYTGGTIEEIILSESQNVAGADFESKNYLEPIKPEDYGKEYKILDLKYEKDIRDGTPKFLLTIKNIGIKPVQEVSFKTTINGIEVLGFHVSGFGSLLDLGEVKDSEIFDMEYCYKSYLIKLEQEGKKLPYYELDIKLVSEDNGSIFEKHISINDLKAEVIKKQEGNFISYDVVYK